MQKSISVLLRAFMAFTLTFCVLHLYGQTDVDTTPTNYPDLYSSLVAGLVMVWGYVAKSLGLKEIVPNFVFVVIAGAVVIIGIFLALGFGEGISHVIAVLTSMGIFDILKGFKKNA